MQNKISRRQFLQVTGASAAALLLAGLPVEASAASGHLTVTPDTLVSDPVSYTHLGLGVGFRHRDSSLFYKVHKNKNAPAEITAGAWVFVKLQKIARTPANSLRRHCPDQVKGTPLSADLSLTAPLFLCPWSV